VTDHPSVPTEGFYLYRKVLGRLPNGKPDYGPYVPCRISREVTPDPYFDNPQDRSPVYHAFIAEEPVDIDEIWPWCAAGKISMDAYYSFVISGRE
jgi:hypothetical protein